MSVILKIGQDAIQPKENQVILHVENPQKNLSPKALSKHLIDYLVDMSFTLTDIKIDGANEHSALAEELQKTVTEYFKERPTQPPTIIFRDNQHTFSFRYELFLDDGNIWIRSKPDFVGRTEGWYKLPTVPTQEHPHHRNIHGWGRIYSQR